VLEDFGRTWPERKVTQMEAIYRLTPKKKVIHLLEGKSPATSLESF
jgi:hypothetical protein